jgi:hypothetical protein
MEVRLREVRLREVRLREVRLRKVRLTARHGILIQLSRIKK